MIEGFETRIQTEDFDPSREYADLRTTAGSSCGAITCFVGLVRDSGDYQGVSAIELEHYPGMTENALDKLLGEAKERWPLLAAKVIHRVGKLSVSDQIVYVGVASSHRIAAFEAAQFLMDTLKTSVPLWKKEHTENASGWVQAKASDQAQELRWDKNDVGKKNTAHNKSRD